MLKKTKVNWRGNFRRLSSETGRALVPKTDVTTEVEGRVRITGLTPSLDEVRALHLGTPPSARAARLRARVDAAIKESDETQAWLTEQENKTGMIVRIVDRFR